MAAPAWPCHHILAVGERENIALRSLQSCCSLFATSPVSFVVMVQLYNIMFMSKTWMSSPPHYHQDRPAYLLLQELLPQMWSPPWAGLVIWELTGEQKPDIIEDTVPWWSPGTILLADIDRHSISVALLHQHLLRVLVAVREHPLFKVKVEPEQIRVLIFDEFLYKKGFCEQVVRDVTLPCGKLWRKDPE